jgi:hypothetical protein
MPYLIFFLSFSRLLTKDDLPEIKPSMRTHTHFVRDEEGEGFEIDRGEHTYAIQGKALGSGQKPPRYPVRKSGLRGSGSYGYKHILSNQDSLLAGFKNSYNQSIEENLSTKRLNEKKNLIMTNSIGYERILKDGRKFSVTLNTDLPLMTQNTHFTQKEGKRVEDSRAAKHQGPGACISVTKTF